jgi:ribonucleoside-diphosphate reductase beta chain
LGFSQIFALARSGKLKNTAEQYTYIWRDEVQHSTNCLWLIRQIVKENPILWDNQMVSRARMIIDEAVELEIGYAHASMPDGGIIGMSVNTYIEYAKFMADAACRNIGVKPLFNSVKNPVSWMSEFELNREKNFFESRVTEYRTGANIRWDTLDESVKYAVDRVNKRNAK